MKHSNVNAGKPNNIVLFINQIKQRIADVFKPEEVEVTFKEDAGGNVVSYTYTKVAQKNVA